MERRGYYHQKFGGQYMPEALMGALSEMEGEHQFVAQDQCFTNELNYFCNNYGGRKTPLYKARLLSKKYGPDIYLKREDLLPYGGSSFEAIAGQMIIGKRIGRRTVLIPIYQADHGCIASALAAANGMKCHVMMPEQLAADHSREVSEMQLNHAEVTLVKGNFEDACEAAWKIWIQKQPGTVYIFTRAAGPHPYPLMVREYQKVIGEEIKEQIQESCGRLPELIVAAADMDGSAVGTFYPFTEETGTRLVAVEKEENPVLDKGTPGISQGMCSLFIQDEKGRCLGSQNADMIFPAGAEPELAAMAAKKKVNIVTVTREEARAAALELAALEGIFPDENSAYAVAEVIRTAGNYRLDENVVVVLSGRPSEKWMDECLGKKVEQ